MATNNSKKKKMLIISSWGPVIRRGGPLMLDNLLRYFPKNSYLLLAKGSQPTQWLKNGSGKAIKYYFYESPFSRVLDYSQPLWKIKMFLKINYLIRKYSLPFPEIMTIILTGLKVIRKEKPSFLFGTSTGNPLIATYLLHLLTKKPYVIMLFDLYSGNLFNSPIDRWLAQKFEPKILQNAQSFFVTNEGTRQYYSQKYGIAAWVIHNSIPAPNKSFPKTKSFKRERTLIFAGVIYWAQMESILKVIQAVQKIERLPVKFAIYAPQPQKELQKMGIIPGEKISISQAPPEQMQRIIRQADVTLVPLSFHTDAPDIIATATPGKFSEYLCSGVPILVHAPDDSFLARYCREKQIALVVGRQDQKAISQAIIKLLTNKQLRKELISNSVSLFNKEYTAQKNSRFFFQLLFKT